MPRLIAGVTHDIVVDVNNSVQLGLTVKPFTFVMGHQPSFIPRMATGDPSGLDSHRWKAFVQNSFAMGGGQYEWSNAHGNAAFAESENIDIGLPHKNYAGIITEDDALWARGDNMVPTSHASSAQMPWSMTAVAGAFAAVSFTQGAPTFITRFSNKPFMAHRTGAWCYTGVTGVDVWTEGEQAGRNSGLTGVWAPVTNSLGNGMLVSAVKYSGCLIYSESNQIKVWGYAPTVSSLAAVPYTPEYNTLASIVFSYDDKLWKLYKSRLSYLRPGYTTVPFSWTEYQPVGDVDVDTLNTCLYGGRIYLGKEDGLYVFNAGRVYEVQTYEAYRDKSNFKMMVVHMGSLYYNVQSRLYRLTSGGMIERIKTPQFMGTIVSGASHGEELVFVTRTYEGTSDLWVFNNETGGVRKWYNANQNSDEMPTQVQSTLGYLWITPTTMTAHMSSGGYTSGSTRSPVVVMKRRQGIEATPFRTAFLTTSLLDFALPNVDKIFNRLLFKGKISAPNKVNVYYTAQENFDLQSVLELKNGVVAGDYTSHFKTDDPNTPTAFSLDWDIGAAGDGIHLYFRTKPPIVRLLAPESQIAAMNTGQLAWYYKTPYGTWTRKGGITYIDRGTKEDRIDLTNIVTGNSTHPVSGEVYGCEIAILPYEDQYDNVPMYYTGFRPQDANGEARHSWTLLGSFTSTLAVLSFPSDFKKKSIQLRFEYEGDYVQPIRMDQYEIEYLPVDTLRRTVSANIMAIDDIQNKQMVIETGRVPTITSSLWAISTQQSPVVVELPYPAVGTTILAQIKIRAPGANLPHIATGTTVSQSEIPIVIDEL